MEGIKLKLKKNLKMKLNKEIMRKNYYSQNSKSKLKNY